MRAVIIDDELNNINNLRALLQQYCPSVEVIATALSSDEGKSIIQNNQVDLLFLDIQMPQKSGFDLLSELATYTFQVIFITAFDNYAIKAIKFSALDYILKPVNTKELIDAVRKAEKKLQKEYSDNRIKNLLNHLEGIKPEKENLALPLANEVRFVNISEIVFCQSENNYTLFSLADGEQILVSKGLYEYEEILPDNIFIRCHQSYIVNKDFVKSLHREGSVCYLEMKNKQSIPVSRAKKDIVRSKLVSAK